MRSDEGGTVQVPRTTAGRDCRDHELNGDERVEVERQMFSARWQDTHVVYAEGKLLHADKRSCTACAGAEEHKREHEARTCNVEYRGHRREALRRTSKVGRAEVEELRTMASQAPLALFPSTIV